jgi:hypothetical protein
MLSIAQPSVQVLDAAEASQLGMKLRPLAAMADNRRVAWADRIVHERREREAEQLRERLAPASASTSDDCS